MQIQKILPRTCAFFLVISATCWGDTITAEQKVAIEAKIKMMSHWSTDPMLVAAVKEHKAS